MEPPSTDPAAQDKQRRYKDRPVACDACRKRKFGCRGGVPCDRCLDRKIHCSKTLPDDASQGSSSAAASGNNGLADQHRTRTLTNQLPPPDFSGNAQYLTLETGDSTQETYMMPVQSLSNMSKASSSQETPKNDPNPFNPSETPSKALKPSSTARPRRRSKPKSQAQAPRPPVTITIPDSPSDDQMDGSNQQSNSDGSKKRPNSPGASTSPSKKPANCGSKAQADSAAMPPPPLPPGKLWEPMEPGTPWFTTDQLRAQDAEIAANNSNHRNNRRVPETVVLDDPSEGRAQTIDVDMDDSYSHRPQPRQQPRASPQVYAPAQNATTAQYPTADQFPTQAELDASLQNQGVAQRQPSADSDVVEVSGPSSVPQSYASSSTAYGSSYTTDNSAPLADPSTYNAPTFEMQLQMSPVYMENSADVQFLGAQAQVHHIQASPYETISPAMLMNPMDPMPMFGQATQMEQFSMHQPLGQPTQQAFEQLMPSTLMTPQYQSDVTPVQAPQQFYQMPTPQAQMSPVATSPAQGFSPQQVHMVQAQLHQTGQTPHTAQATQVAQAAQVVAAQSHFHPTLTPQAYQTTSLPPGSNFAPSTTNQPLGPGRSTPRSYASGRIINRQWMDPPAAGFHQRVPGQPPRPDPQLVDLQQQGDQAALQMLGFTSNNRAQEPRLPPMAEQQDSQRGTDEQVRANLEKTLADLHANYHIPSLEPPADRPNTSTMTQVPIPGTEHLTAMAGPHQSTPGVHLEQNDVLHTIGRLECLMPNGMYYTLSPQPTEQLLRVDGQQSPHDVAFVQRVDFRVRASSQENIDRSLNDPTAFPANRIGDGIEPFCWLNKAVGGTLSRQHADRLVTSCFEKAMPASRFFYKKPVLQTLDELYAGGDIRVLEVDVRRHNRLAFLYMVLAIGELAEPIRPDCSNHQRLANYAKTFTDNGTLDLAHVQALVLQIHYSMMQHKIEKASKQLLTAIHVARSLGFNKKAEPRKRQDADDDDVSVAEAEARRRVYWAIYCLDVQLSVIHGQARWIYDGEFTGVEKALCNSEEELLANDSYVMPPYVSGGIPSSESFPFIAYVAANTLTARQLHLLYQPVALGMSQRLHRTTILQGAIEDWLNAVRRWKEYHEDQGSNESELAIRQADALSLMFCQLLIVTYKPFILANCMLLSAERGPIVAFDQNLPGFTEGIRRATRASLIAVQTLHNQNRAHVKMDAATACVAFNASLMIHLAVATNEVPHRIWASSLGDAVLAQRMLKANSHRGTVVERYSIILEEVSRDTIHDPETEDRPPVLGLTLPAGPLGKETRMCATPSDVVEMFERDGRTITHHGTGPDGKKGSIKETPFFYCGQVNKDGRGPGPQEWHDFGRLVRADLGSLECFLSHKELNYPIMRLEESLRAVEKNTSNSNMSS